MGYVILRDEKTGEIEKIGRFCEDGTTEKFYQGKWVRDHILYSELLDGLLKKITKTEAQKIIVQMLKEEKIAA